VLQTKKLDDCTYDEILESAMNRLPALCPDWTDYNAHDPGITLLELFSWYEEMQRYHLDHTTEQIRRRLLALLNVEPRPAAAAHALVDLSGKQGVWPEGTAFRTEDGITFELDETAEVGSTGLSAVILRAGQREIDVTRLLRLDDAVVQPFYYGGETTELVLKFRDVDSKTLRLWIRVSESKECPRNPFKDPDQMPRIIDWYWNDELIHPVRDETHAMSISGFVTLPVTCCEEGELHLVLRDPGCEEVVRISDFRIGMFRTTQQQTRRRMFTRTVAALKDTEIRLCNAQAITGLISVFMRVQTGWEQVTEFQETPTDVGRSIIIDTRRVKQDGKTNLMIVCTASDYLQNYFFESDGLPNQEIPFSVEGGRPVGEMLLVCDTLDTDGQIRPLIWHQVSDLSVCGPRDRVFYYDELRENLVFGDGLHGAIVPAGPDSILPAELHISECSLGNIPGGAVLRCAEDETVYFCSSGVGGADAENASEAAIRFLQGFSDTKKCATAEDYARLAMQTPGLRVSMAKAVPGFDPGDPSGKAIGPVVSIVVLPFSNMPLPVPDERFLSAVKQYVEQFRPICTQVNIYPPHYYEVDLQLQVRGDGTLSEELLTQWVTEWFSNGSIGGAVVRNSLMAFLQKKPGVWKIDRLELNCRSSECSRRGMEKLLIPAYGIAIPGKLEISLKTHYE